MATKMTEAIRKLLGARPRLGALLAEDKRQAQARAAAEVLGAELPSLDWHADPGRRARWKTVDELVEAAHKARDAISAAEVARTGAEKEHGIALDVADEKRERAAVAAFEKADREAKMLRARAERLEEEAQEARKAAEAGDHEAKARERDQLIATAKELTQARAAAFAQDLATARAAMTIADRLEMLSLDEPSFGQLAGLGEDGRRVLVGGAAWVGGAHQLQVAFTDGALGEWHESACRIGLLED